MRIPDCFLKEYDSCHSGDSYQQHRVDLEEKDADKCSGAYYNADVVFS